MPDIFKIALKNESLCGYSWPAANAVCNLAVMTGMDEYAGRYAPFAEYMNAHNVNVRVLDAFGQGLNAASAGELQRWPKDAFPKNVDAIYLMIKEMEENGLPTFIMGHSMGSFMVQSLLLRYPHCTSGAILCGSNGGQRSLMRAGYALAKLTVSDTKRKEPAPFLQNLGLGGYAKAVKNRKTDFDWLSVNEENVKEYIADPLCGCENTGGFWLEFLRGMTTIWSPRNLKNLSKDERILIIAGAEDPVGQNGKGPDWLYKTYRALGARDVRLKIYPGMRHEILREAGRHTVMNDILAFLKQPEASSN